VLFTVNTVTGATNVIGVITGAPEAVAVGGGVYANDMAFRPNDNALYAYMSGFIYRIDVSTAVATLVLQDPSDTGLYPNITWPQGNAMDFDSNGTLYICNQVNCRSSVSPYTAFVPLFPFTRPVVGANTPRPNAMKFAPDGTLYVAVHAGGNGGSPIGTPDIFYLGTLDILSGTAHSINVSAAPLDAIAVYPFQQSHCQATYGGLCNDTASCCGFKCLRHQGGVCGQVASGQSVGRCIMEGAFVAQSSIAQCESTGGFVSSRQCCNNAPFPNTCLIGACSCLQGSLVPLCICPQGMCYNGQVCVQASS